jgi:hypothetical protein
MQSLLDPPLADHQQAKGQWKVCDRGEEQLARCQVGTVTSTGFSRSACAAQSPRNPPPTITTRESIALKQSPCRNDLPPGVIHKMLSGDRKRVARTSTHFGRANSQVPVGNLLPACWHPVSSSMMRSCVARVSPTSGVAQR